MPLATGATADVWAARMPGAIEKIVAIKAMSTDMSADSDADAESMFLDEARIVSRIRHPNVGTVIELGDVDDLLFIVMDWIEGEPLQVVMREARAGMPLPIAIRIAQQAAAGLHAAHDLCNDDGKPIGLVHRDVSPQNILVCYDGIVKVIDFGVAKAESNLQRTNVGQLKGKVPYMAPEQAMGDPVDRRTDIFALGVVLYQLVTGKHPFRGENEFATLARIRDKNPADPPRRHVPDLPAALEDAMLTALAKKREQRFATMHEFSRALDRAVPSSPDGNSVLGAYLSELCAPRADKREQAIRDALRTRTGKDIRPVNLGVRPVYQEGIVRHPERARAPRRQGTERGRGALRARALRGAGRQRCSPCTHAPRPGWLQRRAGPRVPVDLQRPARHALPAQPDDAHRCRDRDRAGAAPRGHRGLERVARRRRRAGQARVLTCLLTC